MERCSEATLHGPWDPAPPCPTPPMFGQVPGEASLFRSPPAVRPPTFLTSSQPKCHRGPAGDRARPRPACQTGPRAVTLNRNTMPEDQTA
ncbi:hypothetical protein AAFF_G00430460 [Aldrovandia affinis]|uniref:Uncharacterized protein n=1 Tax=Aldrovandia affinis TaxID=143900 RepID=A0AAD7WII2_9TELE|nr:hypothetical protein AAFF_G00430460 [Aldrovandia affinis]